MFTANIIKILISCPADVQHAVEPTKKEIYGWNSRHAEAQRLVLLPYHWSTHATPEMGDRPQAIINKQIVNNCDMIVAFFHKRVGSPTGKYDSGTIEEIEECIKANKPVLVYFSKESISPDEIDATELAQLREFEEKLKERGLYGSFKSIAEFESIFPSHLARTVENKFRRGESVARQASAGPIEPALSNKAKLILGNAALGKGGMVSVTRARGGLYATANNSPLCKPGDTRDEAECIDAIEQLVEATFLEKAGNGTYRITSTGFEYIDSKK